MNHLIILASLAFFGGTSQTTADPLPADAGAPFKIPDDAAGKLLVTVLPPQKWNGPLENPERPARPPAPVPPLAGMGPQLTEFPALLPRFGPRSLLPIRPRVVARERIDEGFGPPQLPDREAYVTLPLTRETSEPVIVPSALPLLGERPVDRVPLEDPTAEASTVATQTSKSPERTSAIPYVRFTIPDPFELRKPLSLPALKDAPTPQVPNPPSPREAK